MGVPLMEAVSPTPVGGTPSVGEPMDCTDEVDQVCPASKLHEHNLPGPCTATDVRSLFIVRRTWIVMGVLVATSARAAMHHARLQRPGL